MPLRSTELAQIVWAETKTLGFGSADGGGQVNGVRRMVAQLAASTNGEGFDRRESLPPTNESVYRDTIAGLLTICEGSQNAAAPQSRLIFWESGDKTDRPNLSTIPPPPTPWTTMPAAGITYQGRFQTQAGGRLVDVFARAPLDGAEDTPVMVNALSGTGLPAGLSIVQPAAAAQARPGVGVALFFVALALFLLAALWAFGNGLASRLTLQEFAKTASILPAANPAPTAAPAAAGAGTPALPTINCDPDPPTDPLAYSLGPQAWRSSDACVQRFAEAQKQVAAGIKPNGWREWYASTALSLTGSGGWTVSLVLPLVLALGSFAVLFVACGYGIVGLAWGALIDVRNRMSLTLAQFILWSIVILAGWLVLGLYNFGFAGAQFGDLDQAATATQTPELAKAVKAFILFPSVPYSLMGIIGLASVTPLASRFISGVLSPGDGQSQPPQEQPPPQTATGSLSVPAYLDKRSNPSDARLSDVVVSEVADAPSLVDSVRVQHAGITGLLVFGYTMLLFDAVSAIDPVRVALSAVKSTSVFTSMPAIDGTFVALLAVSHAALLGSKVNDKRKN
jgi:hypothetical protein